MRFIENMTYNIIYMWQLCVLSRNALLTGTLFQCYSSTFICDAIYGNQSEVEHVTFPVFYFIEVLSWRGTFY